MQREWSSAPICAICCGLLSACSLLTDDGPYDANGAPIQTDRLRYGAQVTDTPQRHVRIDIPMVFVNKTDATAYLIGCRHPAMPVLQKRVGNDWMTVYAPAELLCLSPPWTVRPGRSYRDTLRVYGQLSGESGGPTFDRDLNGTYRLVRVVYADPGGRHLLPDSFRISHTFEIENATHEGR